jgi:hypothetical protein
MAGKLLSDVSDVSDADDVMMVSYYFAPSYSLVSHSLKLDALLHMACHHCCRVDTITGAWYSLTRYGRPRWLRSHR